MRPIDADALKFSKVAEVNGVLTHVLTAEDINNAPTVEYPFYQEAYQTGFEEGKNERPRGEWNIHRVAFHLTCPFCGCNVRALKHEVFEGNYDYNFCINCGADLRGDKNG